MTLTEHLLLTKIQVPPLPANTIQRRRLFKVLDRGLHPNTRLTLVSAPAGYGKTTLLSSWIHDRGLPVAWLSLDKVDNDPIRFMRYLLSALKRENPEFELPSPSEGQFSEDETQEQILILLINQISQSPNQTLLLLDDYHLIHSQAVHDRMGFLLENLPPQAQVFIATRADPPLPITRLRGRGQVNELRMEDLRFWAKEAESFLGIFPDLGLDSDDIKILTDRTEGWISGLQMAAVSLQGHEDKATFIRSFSGSHHYIMDYLLDEVLRRQSPEVLAFLLNTSILDRLCGPLCEVLMEIIGEALTPSQQILMNLERANLFIVPLDDHREWYRYHRLFGELLQARLQRENPERITMLHHRASQWFEDHSLMDEAVHHALLTHDHNFSADLIERTSQETFMRSETMTFLRWVQRLPEEEIQKRPKLGIYRAWAFLFHGAPLSTVEALLEKGDEVSGPPGSPLVLKAYLTLSQGQLEQGLELAERALELLPQEEIVLRDFATFCISASRVSLGDSEGGIELFKQTSQISQQSGNKMLAVLILCKIAELRSRQLQFKESQELYQKALNMAIDEQGEHLPIAGPALIGLGNLALEHYKLEEAERLLQEGIQLARRWHLISTLGGYISMALLHEAQGNMDSLMTTLEILHELSQRFDASEFDDLAVEIVEMGIKSRNGDLDAVRQWASHRGLDGVPDYKPISDPSNSFSSRLYKYQLPVLIRLQIKEQNYDKALKLLDELSAEALRVDRPSLQIEAEILRAKAFHARGDLSLALAALQYALEMAFAEKAMRAFLIEGEEFLHLLNIARSKLDSPELNVFIDQLLQKIESPTSIEPQPTQNLTEPLSPRELEILHLLPTRLTASQLAEELFISVNTVRSHLKSIYTKLGVHSRHEAIIRANDLNLL